MTCTPELWIAGERCGLRIRRALGFASRLLGFLPTPRAHAVDVIEFPRCRMVHTFGMLQPIDVVFVDASGVVLRVVPRLKPWRVAGVAAASAVFEFREGLAAQLGVAIGIALRSVEPWRGRCGCGRWRGGCGRGRRLDPCGHGRTPMRSRERGSSMIEFTLAVVLVVLPLVSGILEFAQLAAARQVLALATGEAARTLAVAGMDAESTAGRAAVAEPPGAASVRLSLARGLLPMLGGDFASAREAVTGLERWAVAVVEAQRPDRIAVNYEIAVVTSADIVVGRLQVTYCRELFFPPASHLLPPLMSLWTLDPFSLLCLEQGRVPIAVSVPVSRSRHP